MRNPAIELLTLLRIWAAADGPTNNDRRRMGSDESLVDLLEAMRLLGEVREEIIRLGEAGRQVRLYEQMWPVLVRGVVAQDSGWGRQSASDQDFPPRELDTLEHLADVLDYEASPQPLNPEGVALLRAALDEALALASEDEGLDDRLRVHLNRTIRHLRTCIEEYDERGHSITLEAWENVWVAFTAAQTKSSDPSRWKKVADAFFWPTASGIVASLPSVAVALGQIGS